MSPPRSDGRIRVLHLGGPVGMFGAERWILALGRHLPSHLVQSFVGVVKDAPGGEPPLCEHAQRLGLPVVVIEAPGRLSLPAVPALRACIRERGIDIVHTHGYKTDILGVLATRGLDCRLVSTPHGWSTAAGSKLRLYEALDRLAFGLCDRVVPLSEDLMAGLRRLPWVGSRAKLITNGVDLSEITESGETATEVAEFRAEGGRVIGYVGQLIPRKRIDTLIRAFAQLADGRARLYLVGDGPERQKLQDLTEELGLGACVRFTGFRDDRLAYLRGFDVFAIPSALEGIPRSVMEAMAAAIPVVASDIEGNRALVRGGETGLLFPVGDHAALAAALRTVLDDQSLRSRLAASARELVRERFSAERMAREYLYLYQELLRDREASGGPMRSTA